MKQNIAAPIYCLFFVALGIFALYFGGPTFVAWMLIIFFGFSFILLTFAAVYEKKTGKPFQLYRPKPGPTSTNEFTLKDGRLYKIKVTDDLITLTTKETQESKEVVWKNLTDVFIVAVDELPVGKCSFVLHQGEDLLEVPIDAEGNEQLLESMQNKLPGFDNEALIEAMGMLHGFKNLWSKN